MVIITFDCYGTLVDWVYSLGSYISKYVDKDAVEEFFLCDFEEVKTYRPYSEILKTCLKKIMDSRKLKYTKEHGEAFVRAFAKSPPFPDTLYGLLKLKKKGFKIGIISNTEKKLIRVTLAGLLDLIDYIITAEDTGFFKPDVRAFKNALEILGADTLEIIHVSSYPHYDLIPARELGLRTIHVKRYKYTWPEEVQGIDELADYLN